MFKYFIAAFLIVSAASLNLSSKQKDKDSEFKPELIAEPYYDIMTIASKPEPEPEIFYADEPLIISPKPLEC